MSWSLMALAIFLLAFTSEYGMQVWTRARHLRLDSRAFRLGRWSLLALGLNVAAALVMDRQVPLVVSADAPALLWLAFLEGTVLLAGLGLCGLSWASQLDHADQAAGPASKR